MINHADEEDTLYRVATPSVTKGGKGKDFILLASRRKPCDFRCCALQDDINQQMSSTVHIVFALSCFFV